LVNDINRNDEKNRKRKKINQIDCMMEKKRRELESIMNETMKENRL
jgi:hypothetical protein